MTESTAEALIVADIQPQQRLVSEDNPAFSVIHEEAFTGREVQSPQSLNIGNAASCATESRPLMECVYISVACAPCECVRLALSGIPKDEVIPCPACGRPSRWTLLARGATVRPLPFYQRMRLGEDRKGQSRVPWTIYDTYERGENGEARKEELEDL